MKETHKIDELFKRGLADYKSELPSEKTKDKIFGRLAYYQYLKWILTSIVVLLFISGSIWAIYNILPQNNQKQDEPIILSKPIVLNKNTINNISTSETVIHTKPIVFKHSKFTENKANTPLIETKEPINKKTEEQNNLSLQTASLTLDNNLNEILVSENNKILEPVFKSEDKSEIKPEREVKIADSENKISNEKTKTEGLIKKTYKSPIISRFELLLSENLYFVDKNLSASTEYENLVKIRKEGENSMLTWSPLLEIRYNFTNFFIQSGLQYQKYGEKVDFHTSETIRNITDNWLHKDTLYYVKDSIEPPGSWHLDTIWYVVKDTAYKTNSYTFKKKNTYNYFELPFLLGKKIQINNLSLEIASGISLGFLLNADAEIIATDGKSTILLNDKKSPYFNSLMINYLLRIYLRYPLNDNWSVFVSPNLKYNLSSIFNENAYPIKQNYMLYGIGCGLTYKF